MTLLTFLAYCVGGGMVLLAAVLYASFFVGAVTSARREAHRSAERVEGAGMMSELLASVGTQVAIRFKSRPGEMYWGQLEQATSDRLVLRGQGNRRFIIGTTPDDIAMLADASGMTEPTQAQNIWAQHAIGEHGGH